VDVNGNGESIYYVLSEGDSVLMGMNRMLCSNMTMRFEGNQLNNISFYVKPEATFYPPHEITADLTTLEGFVWRADERPTLKQVLSPIPPEELLPKTDSLGNPIKKPPRTVRPVQKSGATAGKGAANGNRNGASGTLPDKTNLQRDVGVKKKENGQ
jgi:hypothetical protein